MRDQFPGYYRRSEGELDRIWEEGLFVLDANVLLNLYRYSEKVREDLLGVLRVVQDRLWIPNQVAEEFHRRRLDVIKDQKEAYPKVREVLKAAQSSVAKVIKGIHEDRGIETRDLLESVKTSFDGFIAKAQRLEKESGIQAIKPTNSPEDDEIWLDVLEILEGRTGEGLPQDRKKRIFQEEGPRRYAAKVPPGYEDSDKPGDRKFDDLVLWFEIIEKAKETKKPILLVTDDQKDDWWQSAGGKASEPHPELVNEMHREAGVLFHAFLPLKFLKWAGSKLDREISQEAEEQIDELHPFERQRENIFELEEQLEELLARGDPIRDIQETLNIANAARTVQDFDAARALQDLDAAKDVASRTDGALRQAAIMEHIRRAEVDQAIRAADVGRQIRGVQEAVRGLDKLQEAQDAIREFDRIKRGYGP